MGSGLQQPPPTKINPRHEYVADVNLSPETVTGLVHAAIPMTGHLGLRVLKIHPGFVELMLPFEPNRNHLGTVYAGSLVALAEIPGGLIPMSMPELNVAPVVLGLDVRFLRAGRGAVFLKAAIEPEKLRRLAATANTAGKAEFTLDTEAHDESGELLLTCHGTYQLRPSRG